MNQVLLIEDTDNLREILVSVLECEGFEVDPCSSAEEALPQLDRKNYDCVVCDFKLHRLTGIDFLKKVKERHPQLPFLLMTAFGTMDLVVQALRLGASDFISKPFNPDQLCSAIHTLIERNQKIDSTCSQSQSKPAFLGKDAAIEKLIRQADKVSAVDTSVLILGESGTGKEVLARYIHEHSPRRHRPFLAVNCSAMPADLLESEFFGHEAGAYTGATHQQIGIFEQASGGTIFLDEIGEMPPTLQVKLLRVIQERELKRLGGSKTIKVNPRIISATNHDIEKALQCGMLREDLYFRIAVVSLTIPPLRERQSDIDFFVSHFIEHFSTKTGKDLSLSEESRKILMCHNWPGNVRELENTIERAAIMAEHEISPEHLGLNLQLDLNSLEEAAMTLTEMAELAAKKTELDLVKRALEQSKGNKSLAARMLGVSYKTLLNKVKEHRIEV